MLAILSTHPIQYYAPIYKLLKKTNLVPFEVWYLTSHGVEPTLDPEFGTVISWELDLLDEYPYIFPSEKVPFSIRSFWSITLPNSFREKLISGDIKAILLPGWNLLACWQAAFIAYRYGISVWVRGDSNDLKRDAFFKSLIKSALLRLYFKRISYFFYVGSASRRLYKKYGVEDEKLIYSPHAIDNDRFISQSNLVRTNRNQIREQWGIPNNAYCILFVGKLIPKKRPFDIINALKILKIIDKEHNYHVLFVGSGELTTTLQNSSRVVYEPLNGIVKFDDPLNFDGRPSASYVGFLNQIEISNAYVAADILVLPSMNDETWGLVVNESMASGLPAIVSDECGCAEDLIMPINPRMRYPMGDIMALAYAINFSAKSKISNKVIIAHVTKYNFLENVNALINAWKSL